MTTNYASQVLSSINEDAKARRAEYAARGIRDIITTMTWATGLVEVSGSFTVGRFGPGYKSQTLAAWAKSKFGTGSLRLVARGNVQGRPTATYEVR
jgi:hypothetical protein